MSSRESGLDVRIERGLPATLPAGSSSSLFVLGVCFHERLAIDRLELLADGVASEATAHGIARIDVYRELHPPSDGEGPQGPDSASDPNRRSYRSGFWGFLPVRMPASGTVEIALRATLEDGTISEVALEGIRAEVPGQPRVAEPTGPPPAIAICMATFEPDEDLFFAQVDSIRAQSATDWVCLISDDCSSAEALEVIHRVVGDDPRFVVSRSEIRLGFYRNFERALGMVPPGVDLVALSDQDDRWYPEKLEVLRRSLGRRSLVYSDQRLVDAGGNITAVSFWHGRRSNNYKNLASLLIANTVTGAASLFRRDLLDVALPFPDPPGTQYHDHWLALVALVSGGISYVDQPLYDYVQHSGATLGYESANLDPTSRESSAEGPRGRLIRSGTGSRVSYFFAVCRLRVLAEVLLMRAGGRMEGRSRRTLERFLGAQRSLTGIGWLFARRMRARFGRTETLDAERVVLLGIAWAHAIGLYSRLRSTPIPGVTYDAQLPLVPANPAARELADEIDHPGTRVLAKLVEPLRLSVSETEPERVNVLLPTIELRHLFGGYIAKFNLARKLAEAGLRVRILTVDPTPALPKTWREQVEGYAGLEGLFEQVEVEFARDRDAPVSVNPRDSFVATTWWTARIASEALKSLDRERFLYLIQEYEPFTHPMGSHAAAAMSTYELPHVALFSTELLRDYFAARRYGVFAEGERQGDERSLAFQNAITAVAPPTPEEMAARGGRRLLFYARPETHGARNMFELGLIGLATAISRGVFEDGWEFAGIGTVGGGDRRVGLPGGHALELLPKRSQGDYAQLLPTYDVGLSLMCTPHPSLVPLEMASAGLLTVTNSFETKTPEAMAAIAGNLITVPPSVDCIVTGLEQAVARVGDHEGRVAGAGVEWSRDWEDSFNPELMRAVVALLASS